MSFETESKEEVAVDRLFFMGPPGSACRPPIAPRVGAHLKMCSVGGVHYAPFEQAYDIAQGQSAFFNPHAYPIPLDR